MQLTSYTQIIYDDNMIKMAVKSATSAFIQIIYGSLVSVNYIFWQMTHLNSIRKRKNICLLCRWHMFSAFRTIKEWQNEFYF